MTFTLDGVDMHKRSAWAEEQTRERLAEQDHQSNTLCKRYPTGGMGTNHDRTGTGERSNDRVAIVLDHHCVLGDAKPTVYLPLGYHDILEAPSSAVSYNKSQVDGPCGSKQMKESNPARSPFRRKVNELKYRIHRPAKADEVSDLSSLKEDQAMKEISPKPTEGTVPDIHTRRRSFTLLRHPLRRSRSGSSQFPTAEGLHEFDRSIQRVSPR